MIPLRRMRKSTGNMISMTALIGGLIILACVVAFCFYMLLAEQRRGQTQVDEVAMSMAKNLNTGDRVGQINNTVARSRELVYVSRMALNTVQQKNYEHWAPLAAQLCDEARNGAAIVERERQNQVGIARKSLQQLAERHNAQSRTESLFNLPWWQTYDTQVTEIDCGYVNNIQSNVLNTEVYPDLRLFDEQKHYFQKGSNLYLGGINAKLPPPDSDLDFKIASLAAPVETSIAPARMINSETFKPFTVVFIDKQDKNGQCDQIPTAVRVVGEMGISAMNKERQQVQVSATAASNGALPPP